MAQSPIMAAIQQICQEKNITVEAVISTIESALAAAYRKDFGQKNQNIVVEYDAETGGSRVFDVKTVVEDELAAKAAEEARLAEEAAARGEELPAPESAAADEGEEAELKFNPKFHISLSDARQIKQDTTVGEEIRVELEVPSEYGRMAAQTAKQVIIQRLREAERQTIYDDFKDRVGAVMLGTVQRREGPNVLVDIAKATALLPIEEQVERERYTVGQRLKVYIISVELGSRGPEIIVSRRSPEIVRELFAMEIPEVANGLIEIKAIARQAGFRSKVAVHTEEANIDPIGSCVGQRGSRVQTIISELAGEKIDIIQWNENAAEFISHALSPAKVVSVEVNDTAKEATVVVNSDQLSLAIGREGQNVRLASQLTGYKISVVEVKNGEKREVNPDEIAAAETAPVVEPPAEPVAETAPVEPVAEPPVEPAAEAKPKKKATRKKKEPAAETSTESKE